MDIGLGLPSTISGLPGRRIVEWAAAERACQHVGRPAHGIAVGGRQDDYDATGSPFHARGRLFGRQPAEMREIWAGSPRGFAGAVGPAPVQTSGPPLPVGGRVEASFRRMVEHGAGWIFGGGGPDGFRAGAGQARQAWHRGGRPGGPRLVALAYASLGESRQDHARRYLGDCSSFSGCADAVAGGAPTTRKRCGERPAPSRRRAATSWSRFRARPAWSRSSSLPEPSGERDRG